MQCEICGKPIVKGKKIKLEATIVTACEECSKLGYVLSEVKVKKIKKEQQSKQLKEEPLDLELNLDELELVDDFHKRIKNAREKKGLKQEELAKLINEPESLIRRIESGKYIPDERIIKKIERILDIGLLAKHDQEVEKPREEKKVKSTLTLGDVILIRKRKK
ncbi:MAG TPA: TIGR00270 family protein [Candidatus Altiarchaeales archaeon]|nr:TIGR00270 family protein [Candidatus Altiarchaeales archaeon]